MRMDGSTFGLSIGGTQKISNLAAAAVLDRNSISTTSTPKADANPKPPVTASQNAQMQEGAKPIEYRQRILYRQEQCALDGGQPCGGSLNGVCIFRYVANLVRQRKKKKFNEKF